MREVLGWIENDNYGFCHDIEGSVARTLNREGFALFRSHFRSLFEKAFTPFQSEEPRRIYDYPSEVCLSARVLKSIYVAKRVLLWWMRGSSPRMPKHKTLVVVKLLIA